MATEPFDKVFGAALDAILLPEPEKTRRGILDAMEELERKRQSKLKTKKAKQDKEKSGDLDLGRIP